MQTFTRIAAMLLVVVAVALAIAAFSLGRRNAHPAAAQGRASSPPGTGHAAAFSVVTATGALPAGQPIGASSLRLATSTQAIRGGYAAVDAVAGDVPLVDIPAGAVVTANLLAHGVAMALKPGERALAVPVSELAGVGNHVVPGDYVDVFLSLKPQAPAGYGRKRTQPQTRLLLSRLRVLAYGPRNLPTPMTLAQAEAAAAKHAKTPPAAGNARPPQPGSAVLAVPVAEVDKLLLGAQDGQLALALRQPEDPGRPDRALFPRPRRVLSPLATLTPGQRQASNDPENRAFAGIDGAGLAGRANAVPPATRRRAAWRAPRVEIIRGTQAHSL